MNDTIDAIKMANYTEEIRAGKELSLESPLLNLILAASLLSRFTSKPTKGTQAIATPTIMTPPVRYVSALYDNQIPQWPAGSPTRHQYKFHASLNSQQTNIPIRHHVVHVHQNPHLAPSIPEEPKPQMPEVVPVEMHNPVSFTMDETSTQTNEIINKTQTQGQDDATLSVSSSGLTAELKEFLTALFRRNLSVQLQDEMPLNQAVNIFDLENAETGNVENQNVFSNMTEIASAESGQEIAPTIDTTVMETRAETMTEYFPMYTTLVPDSEAAESSVDLQAEEAVIRRTKIPQDYVFKESDEDENNGEGDDDSLEDQRPSKQTQKNQRLRVTSVKRNTENYRKTSLRPKTEPARINSRKPVPKNKKRTTPITLIYDDGEEEVDQENKAPPRRRTTGVTNKRAPPRKTTPFNKDYDFEDEVNYDTTIKRRATTRRKPRSTTTTPTYDYYDQNTKLSDKAHENDYYDSVQDQDDAQYEDEDVQYESIKPKPNLRTTRRFLARQQTTETVTETDSTVTDTDTTFSSTTPSTTTETKTTSGEYPYYGGDHYHNISITYGPPVHHYPGYGPSNGNEHISFTYAPPSGLSSASNPMLDNWYNQYAKASVYKRIQDLLTPNNYYNQYDVNYNDGSL